MSCPDECGWDRNDLDGFAGSPVGDDLLLSVLAWPVRLAVRFVLWLKNSAPEASR